MADISLKRVDANTGEPRLNVVFLHGLGGHQVSTWCHEGGEDGSYFWLRGISEDIENLAVWTLGYPGDKMAWNAGWPVATAAIAVLDKLMSSRESARSPCWPIRTSCASSMARRSLPDYE